MKNTLSVFNEIVSELLEDEKMNPVAEYVASGELYDKLDLSLSDEPIDENKYKAILKDLVFKTPRTATKAFFNQLFGGRNEKAVLGELLSVILNNSMYTYKAAGPMVGVEKIVVRKICDMIGWDENSDGTFAVGGSMTNLMSMLMARDAADENIRHAGMSNKLTVYTSADAHYSVPKNAAFSGIGRDNVRLVPANEKGEMIPEELEAIIQKDIENGCRPIYVNVTAGTTVLGAFDPIGKISPICKKYNLWLHVDGAYCGAVMFSEKYKHLISGVEKVDSFSFNAHKMLGTPLSCSIIVAKEKEYLYRSFSNDASYLYQTDHDDFNLGKMSLQCGRRNDALKFWTLWKSVGSKGLEKIIDKQFMLADVAREYVRENPKYTLYSFDDSISICFNYKDISAREICTALYEDEKLLVGYGSSKGNEFIRLVTINAQNEPEDIIAFFKTLETYVEENKDKFELVEAVG